MNKKIRNQVEAKCRQEILDHGAVETKEKNKFTLTTKIGKAAIVLNMGDPKVKVMSLYVNFKEHPSVAKIIFGHWKRNISEWEDETFWLDVAGHIDDIKDKIADYFRGLTPLSEVDKTAIGSALERCRGLAGIILDRRANKDDAYLMLSDQTGIKKELLLKNEVEVLMLAQDHRTNLIKAHGNTISTL